MKTYGSFFSLFTFATCVVRDGCCSSSDFLVNSKQIEEIEPAFKHFNGSMYSGLLPIDINVDDGDEPRGKLSFWLFNPKETKETLTIWLNGGPGCSSYQGGLFMEVGPVGYPHYPAGHGRTNANQSFVPNDYSWTNATNLLFIEQPTGVGFSYGPDVHSESDLSRDFYNFLVNFFKEFPEMNEKSLYIVGESYAGMYVPSIAYYIHKQNKKGIMKNINLSGIAIGNGVIDAMTMGPSIIDYAYWHGMIDSPTRQRLWKVWEQCQNKESMKAPFHDFTIPDECGVIDYIMILAGGNIFPKNEHYAPNQYDVTTWDNYPTLNTPVTAASEFLNNPKVRKEMHFEDENHNVEWVGCIPGAGRRRRLKQDKLLPGQILLAHDQPESVAPYIANLLDDAKIRVLVYAGDRDIAVNLQGSEKVLNNMTWSGENSWLDADRYLWMVDGDVAGYVKTHNNLDMLLVMNSGHLVPYNVPIAALDLINRLTTNLPYGDIILPKMKGSDEKQGLTEVHNHQLNKFHQSLLVVLLSISCFLIGLFIGSQRGKCSSYSYEKIP